MPVDAPPTVRRRLEALLRLRRAFGLVWRCAPRLTLAGYALTLLQGVLPLIGLYLVKLIVDSVTAALASADPAGAFRQTAIYIAAAGLVAVLTTLIGTVAGLVTETQSAIVTDAMSDVLHAKSVEVDLEYYENPSYYDAFHRAQREAPFRPNRIVNGLGQLAQSGVTLAAIAGLLFSLHPAVALVLLIAATPGFLVKTRYSRKMFAWQRERTESERRAWYMHMILTDGSHAKELRLFDLGRIFRERFSALRTVLREERLRMAGDRSKAEFAAQGLASLIVYSAFVFIAWKAVVGTLTLGDMVMFFQAFQRGLAAMGGLLGSLASLYEDSLFLSNYFEFMDFCPTVVDPPDPRPTPRPIRQGIVFEGVSFRYPRGERAVLEDVDLTIGPGEVIALVGANGSGKTSLIKLLCRLYDPSTGSIRVDGIDLRELAVADLRREIGVIFQDYARYSLSARENIWLGNTLIDPRDHRVEAAAAKAGADGVIRRLPEAYDSLLGYWFAGGSELSIGEWQKVALSRAFLRDAQLVVLDEPTSAMDPIAESEVFAGFRRAIAGRMAILVSHRFSTVKLADRIYVLDHGRVLETGSHAELIARGGTYATMFEAQAGAYR